MNKQPTFYHDLRAPVVAERVIKCPACRSPLYVDEAAQKFAPGATAPTIVRVALCTGCEFVHEF